MQGIKLLKTQAQRILHFHNTQEIVELNYLTASIIVL